MYKKIMLFVMSLLAVIACRKETDDYYWGNAMARFNNASWEAKASSLRNKPYNQGIDFIITRFNQDGYEREQAFLYKIPYKLGRHRLSITDVRTIDSLSGASFYIMTDDGDVLGDSYALLEGIVDNYVEITRIDGDQIWGEFQVAFLRTDSMVLAHYPDTVVLTRGEIHTRVKDFE